MQLWTDLIKPVELTAFSREIVAATDVAGNPATLANIFPSTDPIYGSTYSFIENEVVSEAASFRSFTAEAAIGKSGGRDRKTVELPPLSLKKRLTEYDQVRRMGVNSFETVRAAAERLAAEVSQAVINRLVLARAEALVTGQLVIDEDGFVQTVSFGRAAGNTTAASAKWDATTNPGDPVADLQVWGKIISDDPYAGGAPDVLYMSSTVMAVLMRSAAIRGYFGPAATGIVGLGEIGTLFQNFGIPVPVVLDAKVDGQRLIPEKTIVLARAGAGATPWGQTVEATDPRYGIPYQDQPGLVVGAYQQDDPDTKWIRANAIAMPILHQANATLAATVLK